MANALSFRSFSLVAASLLATFLAACGSAPVAPVPASPKGTPPSVADGNVATPWLPTPFVAQAQVVAGEAFTVACPALRRQGSAEATELAGQAGTDPAAAATDSRVATPVTVPALQPVAQQAGEATFVAQRAGTYAVRCQAGGNAGDAHQGKAAYVQVLAGAPTRVAVVLSVPQVAAGELAVARCTGLDAAGNEVAPPRAQETTHGAGDAPVDNAAVAAGVRLTAASFTTGRPVPMRAVDGRSLELRSTEPGPLAVRCAVADWPHLPSSPIATLQVTPGAASQLQAEVASGPHRVHVPIEVHCRGQDAYANAAPVADARLVVTGPGNVTITGHAFTADQVGDYAVACALRGPDAPSQVSPPQRLTLGAGAPVRWQVHFHRQGCLSKRGRLPLTWEAWDVDGNLIGMDALPAELTAQPAAAIERDDSGGFVFAEEGNFMLTLQPTGPEGRALAPWIQQVVVDSTPPRLVIHSPARGAMLQDGSPLQMLEGEVVDDVSTLRALTINGERQILDPNAQRHAFRVPFFAPWGMTVLHAQAEDACGNVATLAQSLLRSPDYGPVADAPLAEARVDHAARAAVAQPLWDDGDATGGHDISALLQQALQHGGINERLPHHLSAYALFGGGKDKLAEVDEQCLGLPGWSWGGKRKENGWEITRNGNIRLAGPEVEFLHVEEGGVHLALRFDEVRLPLAITHYRGLTCTDLGHSTMRATLAAQALRLEVRATVAMEDGEVRVALCPTCVHADFLGKAPQFLFDDPEAPGNAGFFGSQKLANWLLQHSSKRLGQALEQRVRQDVVNEMQRLLRGLHIDHSFPLPGPLMAQAQVASGVDDIVLRGGAQGGGTSEVSLYTQAYAPIVLGTAADTTPGARPPLRGAIRQPPAAPEPLQLTGKDTFAVRVRDDMLNQLFWSLWAGGAFTGFDPRQYSSASAASERSSNLLDAAHANLFFTSPPILMPGEEDNEVRVAVGDVFADVAIDTYRVFGSQSPPGRKPLAAKFYFSMTLRARLGIDNERGTLQVEPLGSPKVDLQVVEIASPAMHAAVRGWLTKMINKSMPAFLTRPLSAFPLPTLQIGALPGIADGAAWTFEETELERPAGADAFVLRGRLTGLESALHGAQ